MRVAVFGQTHLGTVTAGCLAAAGLDVCGLDSDAQVIEGLRQALLPVEEPLLGEMIARATESGRLRFTTDPAEAIRGAEVLWVTFDTPVDEQDHADVRSVREAIDRVATLVAPGTLVMVSSQVPVGFTRDLARTWPTRGVRFAYSPENLRLGKAVEVFQQPDRVIVGTDTPQARETVAKLLAPFTDRIEWMSLESAEMTKHAINAFLATSVAFINELARVCEQVGADAREVERGLKSESRIGPRAYLAPGAAFAGGTLARDLQFLHDLGMTHRRPTPLVDGVLASNALHRDWTKQTLEGLLAGIDKPVVAILGLTYKPHTSTLRRSGSVEMARWLASRGVIVRAHDPAVTRLPKELEGVLTLSPTSQEAVAGADVAVLATPWPEYRVLTADALAKAMRRARVVDQNWFLASQLAGDVRISYTATGRAGDRTRT